MYTRGFSRLDAGVPEGSLAAAAGAAFGEEAALDREPDAESVEGAVRSTTTAVDARRPHAPAPHTEAALSTASRSRARRTH